MSKHHRLRTKKGAPYQVGPDSPGYGVTTEKTYPDGTTTTVGWEIAENIDVFAFQSGNFCNGPKCVDCGMARCQHHSPEWIYKPDCRG